MPRLLLSLLGPYLATLDEAPVTGFESNKVRALLAYLAVEADRPHRRQTLVGLLWPAQTEAAAHADLRRALVNLLMRLLALSGQRSAALTRYEACCRHLRKDLVRDAAGRWVEGPTPDWNRLPARVEAVIAERVGRLPGGLRALLAAASVEGEDFTAEAAARALNTDAKEIVQRLSGVLSKQHHLVVAQSLRRRDDQRLSGYRFRHYLFQKYLYQSLDEVERAHPHEAIGNALEALYGEGTSEIALQLVRHSGLSPK